MFASVFEKLVSAATTLSCVATLGWVWYAIVTPII